MCCGDAVRCPHSPAGLSGLARVCFLDGCPESKGKKLRLGFRAGRGPSCQCWHTVGEFICILRQSSVSPGLPAWLRGPAQRGTVNWVCGVEQVSGISDDKYTAIHLGSSSPFGRADNSPHAKDPAVLPWGPPGETSKRSWGSKPVLNPRDTFCAKARVFQTTRVLMLFGFNNLIKHPKSKGFLQAISSVPSQF